MVVDKIFKTFSKVSSMYFTGRKKNNIQCRYMYISTDIQPVSDVRTHFLRLLTGTVLIKPVWFKMQMAFRSAQMGFKFLWLAVYSSKAVKNFPTWSPALVHFPGEQAYCCTPFVMVMKQRSLLQASWWGVWFLTFILAGMSSLWNSSVVIFLLQNYNEMLVRSVKPKKGRIVTHPSSVVANHTHIIGTICF